MKEKELTQKEKEYREKEVMWMNSRD